MAKVIVICFILSLLTLAFGAGTSGGGDGQYYYYNFNTNEVVPHAPTNDEGNVTETQDPDRLHFEAAMAGKPPHIRAKFEEVFNKPAKYKEALEADRIKTKEILRLEAERKAAEDEAERLAIQNLIRKEEEKQAAKEAEKAAKEAAEQIQIAEVDRQDAEKRGKREARQAAKDARAAKKNRAL